MESLAVEENEEKDRSPFKDFLLLSRGHFILIKNNRFRFVIWPIRTIRRPIHYVFPLFSSGSIPFYHTYTFSTCIVA